MFDPNIVSQLAYSVPVLLVVFGYLILREKKLREAEEARDRRHREIVDAQRTTIMMVADQHERATDRIAGTFNAIVERHEAVEKEERAVQHKMSQSVVAALLESAASKTEMASALRDLTRQLGRSDDTFHTLAHEVHAMSHESPADVDLDIHPGVPGGTPTPIVVDEYELQTLDLMSENRPWTHRMHGVDALHTHGHDGDPRVLIVVLDTGVDAGHPDLSHVKFDAGRSFTGEPMHDGNGHGTHCTGTVTGVNAAVRRIMGVAHKCTVVHYKVLSNRGSGSGEGIDRAIRAVAELQGFEVKIISGSFGSSGEDPRISAAVRYAHSKGVIQIYAAGNSGPNSPNWPGMLPQCIAVGASDKNGRVAAFSSSHGDYVDVTAGGVDIPSTFPGGRIAVMSGTSMATPLVAGIVGVAVSYALEKTGLAPTDAEVKEALYSTCEPHNGTGRDSRGGYGKVRGPEFADALAKLVAKRVPAKPDPEPTPGNPIRIAVPEGAKFVEVKFATA